MTQIELKCLIMKLENAEIVMLLFTLKLDSIISLKFQLAFESKGLSAVAQWLKDWTIEFKSQNNQATTLGPLSEALICSVV